MRPGDVPQPRGDANDHAGHEQGAGEDDGTQSGRARQDDALGVRRYWRRLGLPGMSPRPFRFGIQASSAASAAEWVELARRAEGNGFSCLTMPDHFGDQLAPVPALMAAAGHHVTARRRAGVGQRLQAPGRAGQGAGDDGSALRGSAGARARRRLDDQRLRAGRHGLRPGARAHRPLRRGADDHPQGDVGRHVLVQRDALHGRRPRRPPAAGAASVPADPHRRRRQAGARHRRLGRPTSSGSTPRCTRAASARGRSPR